MEDPSTPRVAAQKASSSSSSTPQTKIGVFASPRPHNPLRALRTPYLPTPSPSPLSSAMSPVNTAKANSFDGFAFDSLDALSSRMRDFSLSSNLCMTPPHTPLSQNNEKHSSPPPPYDIGLTDDSYAVTKFLGDLGLESELDLNYPSTTSKFTSGRIMYEAFKTTRSRVIRIFNLPLTSSATAIAITRLFFANGIPSDPATCTSTDAPVPVRMWTLREGHGGPRLGEEDSVWAVFRTHEQACSALSNCQMIGSPLSVATALETDLEPFAKLRKFEVRTSATPFETHKMFQVSPQPLTSPQSPTSSASPSSAYQPSNSINSYQISSNPPNPNKLTFRYGDWICASANCAAHNFGRNTNCIGCGSPRCAPSSPPVTSPSFSSRVGSPRFSSHPISPVSPASSAPSSHSKYSSPININQLASQFAILNSPQQPVITSKPPPSTHPLLTPSGRALAVGGKVQNVSSDPLAPCIMYWPDNEPLPEQGQIRPSAIAAVHPPILNTGNRGPIEHQPGDWICRKCDYLNWRRRKVCQTCFPYAEGNGDSVSAAVQAERIALLTSVLTQTQSRLSTELLTQQAQVLAPATSRLPSVHNSVVSPSTPIATSSRGQHGAISRPQSNSTLYSQQWPNSNHTIRQASSAPDFINSNIVYQTPASSALKAPAQQFSDDLVSHGAPLLPSFLQNEIRSTRQHSPSSLSPSSTSSADLSFEDGDDDINRSFHRSAKIYGQRSAETGSLSSGSSSSLTMGISSIWAMDKDENNKPWNAVALPSPNHLIGSRSRTSSHEVFRP